MNKKLVALCAAVLVMFGVWSTTYILVITPLTEIGMECCHEGDGPVFGKTVIMFQPKRMIDGLPFIVSGQSFDFILIKYLGKFACLTNKGLLEYGTPLIKLPYSEALFQWSVRNVM